MKVILKDVRLSYPNLWEPKKFNGQGEAACYAHLLIDRAAAPGEFQKVVDAINFVAKEKWNARAADMLKSLKARGDLCLHDGAEKAGKDGYDGTWFVSARSKTRPLVLDRNKAPLTEADGRPYAGCYVNAVLDVWAQDNGFGKRINAKLLAVQFHRDGDAFGGGATATADDFDAYDGGDDDFGDGTEAGATAGDLF